MNKNFLTFQEESFNTKKLYFQNFNSKQTTIASFSIEEPVKNWKSLMFQSFLLGYTSILIVFRNLKI